MALVFEHRADLDPARVAVFPGAWNPPTVAHEAIARATLQWADEVVWILPRVFPHKTFEGATFDARRRMLRELAKSGKQFSAAVSDGNLHYEIAAEARAAYPHSAEVALVCGRDAVERIATWDYGRPGVFEDLVSAHPILVAARRGEYQAAEGFERRIIPLDLGGDFDEISSTVIRQRIAEGGDWRHLVPGVIAEIVAETYGEPRKSNPQFPE